jgi:hypothetical protein
MSIIKYIQVIISFGLLFPKIPKSSPKVKGGKRRVSGIGLAEVHLIQA